MDGSDAGYNGGNAFPPDGGGYGGGNTLPDDPHAVSARWELVAREDSSQESTIKRGPLPTCATPPTVDDLSTWENAYYWLSTDAAASLSIPIAGSAAAGYKRRVFVADAGRWKDCLATDNSTWVRYGFAVRLVIVVDYIDANLKLTLAGLAAEAQLNRVQTQSILRIQGYVGGGIELPGWREYNVETYRQLMSQADKIKNVVFSKANKADIRPEPLGVATDLTKGADDPAADDATAVARVWALRELANGRNCDDAIRGFGARPESPLGRRIAETYERIAGVTGNQRPSEEARDLAWERLGPLA